MKSTTKQENEKAAGCCSIFAMLFLCGGVYTILGLGENEPDFMVGLIMIGLGLFAGWAVQQLQAQTSQEVIAENSSGKVYLLKSGKYYKIGVTTGPIADRVNALQTGSPYSIEVVHLIETPNPYGLEAELHKQFADKRRQGEWFELGYFDVQKIKKY